MGDKNEEVKIFSKKADHPVIKVCKPNSYYAVYYKDSYAGRDSEMTKTCQYLYHHFLMSEINKEIADILYNIAKVNEAPADACKTNTSAGRRSLFLKAARKANLLECRLCLLRHKYL